MTTLAPAKTTTKQKFVDALRSGTFIQCQDLMKTETAYCALGVFHAINGDPEINDMNITALLPTSIFNRIANLNDTGKTFAEIADILDSGLSEDLQSLNYGN